MSFNLIFVFALLAVSQCRMLNVTTTKELYNAFVNAGDFDYINIAPGEYIVHQTITSTAKFVTVNGPADRSAKFTCPNLPKNEPVLILKTSYWNFKNIYCGASYCLFRIFGDYNYISNSTITAVDIYGTTNEFIYDKLNLINNYGFETIITNNYLTSANCFEGIYDYIILDYSTGSLIYQNEYVDKGRKVNYRDNVEYFVKAMNSTKLLITENNVNFTCTDFSSNFKFVQFEKSTSNNKVMDNVISIDVPHKLYPLIVDNGKKNVICASNVLKNQRKFVKVELTDKMLDPSC